MELKDLNGVGNVTLQKLQDADVENIEQLAQVEIDDLIEAGIGDNKAEKLINSANRETVIIQSGDEVVQEYSSKEFVTTGMDVLDDAIGGGYREGDVISIAGPSGSGKTQLAFYALVNGVESTGKPAVYIETEPNRYSPKRLTQLAKKGSDTQAKVHRVPAYDLEQQELAYQKLTEHFEDCSIVVVDSFTANFRLSEEFEGRGTLSERSVVMGKHLRGLNDVAEQLGVPIVITAQVYGNPSGFGSPTSVYGGSLFQHTVNYFLMMKDAQGDMLKAKVANHPEMPEEDIFINVGNEDIAGMLDN